MTEQAVKSKQTILKEQKALIRRKFKEYLPKGIDPIKVYSQWKTSIFGSNDADDSIMHYVLGVAMAAGIDPRIPKQIYAIPYNVNNRQLGKRERRWNIIVGIEGMVTIAERSGQYGGTTKPEYEFGTKEGMTDHSNVISCTIGVYKVVQGIQNISYQTVYFDEYTTNDNLWLSKPKTMIKKVALAHALRATFTACAGLNIPEELDRRDFIEGEVVTASPDLQARVEACKTTKDLQKLLNSLSPEDKVSAQPFVEQKISEL